MRLKRLTVSAATSTLAAACLTAGMTTAAHADYSERNCGSTGSYRGWSIKTCMVVDSYSRNIYAVTHVYGKGNTDVRVMSNLWENCAGSWQLGTSTKGSGGTLEHAYQSPTDDRTGTMVDWQGCQWTSHGWITDTGGDVLDVWAGAALTI